MKPYPFFLAINWRPIAASRTPLSAKLFLALCCETCMRRKPTPWVSISSQWLIKFGLNGLDRSHLRRIAAMLYRQGLIQEPMIRGYRSMQLSLVPGIVKISKAPAISGTTDLPPEIAAKIAGPLK